MSGTVSPGDDLAAVRELSHRRLLGPCAAALPVEIRMVQGTPGSHLGPEQGS
jgi:hypothetical protein